MQVVQVNKRDCRSKNGWDIYNLDGEKIAFAEELVLFNCKFVVDKELKINKPKDIKERFRHAWVEGEWTEGLLPDKAMKKLLKVNYRPHLDDTFKYEKDKSAILEAPKVYCFRSGTYVD